MNDTEQFIRDYIPDVAHMSLATCADNKPWVCEVHFVYDNDLNLYFMSSRDRRHSLEIAKNPQVSGNIVKQHAQGEKPSGVYFEGAAEKVEDTSPDSEVYKLYVEKIGEHPLLKFMPEPNGPRFYKITVSDFYVFDATGKLGPPNKYRVSWRQ